MDSMNQDKTKKIRFVFPVILIFLLLITGTAFYLYPPEIYRCLFISLSPDFEKIGHEIYISKNTPDEIRDSVYSLIKEADNRVKSFWESGKRVGNPKIIYCHSNDALLMLSRKKSVVTYKTPINCYIIISKNSLDLDIISHELFHTEFAARIGYLNSMYEIPVWFDEGLAMQVDYRSQFSDSEYDKCKDRIEGKIKLSELTTSEEFWSDNYYLHYLKSGHEINQRMKKSGKKGLKKLITSIKEGESFSTALEKWF